MNKIIKNLMSIVEMILSFLFVFILTILLIVGCAALIIFDGLKLALLKLKKEYEYVGRD